MSRFISYFQYSSGDERKRIGSSQTHEEAVDKCVKYVRNEGYLGSNSVDECRDSLESRDYYIIGFGPQALYVEEE